MSDVIINKQDVNLVISESEDNSVVVSPSVISSVTINTRGPQGPGGVMGLHGSFIDTTDQPLISTAAAQPVLIGTTIENRGVSITSGSRITFELAGTYAVLASLQVTNNGNNISEVDFFLKKNGTTVPNSNTRIDIHQRKSVTVPHHECFTIEYQLTVGTNDYVELWWIADHIDITLETLPSDGIHPQAPSVIVNVAQVMYAQTGTPPGGNIGDLVVKASGTDYDTVWTDAPTVDKLGLDLTAAESVSTGQIAWNATEGTVDVGLLHGTTNQIGQETQMLCKNSAASITIQDGMGVMFTGADPSTLRLEVQPMVANGNLPGYVFFGVATQTIAPGAEGYITVFGKVRGIDTSAYPEDSILWCDPVNPGLFVTTEPVAPQLKIAAAAVIKSHPTDGVIMVRADSGQNLADCHDVETDTAQDTDYLGWSEDMQHWMPYSVPNAAPRSITITEPFTSDSFTLFRTSKSTTLAGVTSLVAGISPSVTYEIRYAANRTASGTIAVAPTVATNTTTGSGASVQNMPIPSGNYVWLNITATSGTPSEFNLSVAF